MIENMSSSTGVDLISGVSCDAPYNWSDKTDTEWEFNREQNLAENFHVSMTTIIRIHEFFFYYISTLNVLFWLVYFL